MTVYRRKTVTCAQCGIEFETAKDRFHSNACRNIYMKLHPDERRTNRGSTQQHISVTCPCGVVFGTTQQRVADGRGKFCSKPCLYAFRDERPSGLTYRIVVQNSSWFSPTGRRFKGTGAEYRALHKWVRKVRGLPGSCEHCGSTTKITQWANISQEYQKIPEDWMSLCVRCHHYYDRVDA